ncbi:MAG: hypothetical protein ACXWCX_21275, partial [Burkholderiales bacterium]
MAMKQSTDAKLEVRQAEQAVVSDGSGKPVVTHLLIVRVGPLHLAAHATHMDVAQAPSMFLEI